MHDGGTQVGSASFGVGIDLAQFRRDLDRAEKLARERAQRIQRLFSNIRIPVEPAQATQAGTQRTRARRAQQAQPTVERQTQQVVVTRQIRVVGQTTIPAVPTRLPVVHVDQTIEVRRTFIVVDQQRGLAVQRGIVVGAQRGQPALTSPGLPAPPPSRITVREIPRVPRGALGGVAVPFALPSGPRVGQPAPRQLALPARGQSSFVSADNLRLYRSFIAAGMSPENAARAAGLSRVPDQVQTTPRQQQVTGGGRQAAANALYQQLLADGVPPDQAAKHVRGFIGVDPQTGVTSGRTGVPAGRPQNPREARERLRAVRAQQQRAERDARVAGRPFSVLRTGRQVGTTPFQRQQQVAEAEAREEGRPFSVVRTARTVGPRGPGGTPPGPPSGGAFGFSPEQIRVGAALLGIPLGINIFAGIARDIHQAVNQTIKDATDLEQAVRAVGIQYARVGQQQIQRGVGRFLADPTTRGTEQQFLQMAAALGPLSQQFGLTREQVTQLVTSEGQLARIHGVDLPQAGQVLENVLRGNVEAGQALGIQLTDEYGRLRSVGVSFEVLTQQIGRTRAEQILFRDVQASVAQQQRNSAQSSDALSVQLDILGKAWDNLRSSVTRATTGPVTVAAGVAANILRGQTGGLPVIAPGQFRPAPTREEAQRQFNEGQARGAAPREGIARFLSNVPGPIGDFARGIADSDQRAREAAASSVQLAQSQQQLATSSTQTTTAVREQTQHLRELDQTYGLVLSDTEQLRIRNARLIGSSDQLGTIINFQVRAAQAGTLANAAQGPTFPLSPLTDIERRVIAQQRAEQAQAQRDAQLAASTAESSLSSTNDQVVAQGRLVDAEHEQAVAQNQITQAQTRVDTLTAQQEQRRLGAQQQLNDNVLTQIRLQDQVAPALLREAEIRDRITLASQENLDLTQRKIQAEQAALPASQQIADLTFREEQATQRAVVSAVDQLQGRVPRFDIGQQVEVIKQAEFERLGGADLANLEAQRRVQLADQAQQAFTLQQQSGLIGPRREAQAAERDIIPQQAAQRLAQAQADALERAIQASNLEAGPELIQAQTALLNARLSDIASTGKVAAAQAAVAGLPPIQNNITIPGNVMVDPELVQKIVDAASTGALKLLIDARDTATSRVTTDIPGGR